MKNPLNDEVKWINTEIELPPIDGWYWASNHPENPFDFGPAYYDGLGFSYERIYRNVKFWSFPVGQQKKYGKI